MPTHNAARRVDPDERLSQLIRLKRSERPSSDFWLEFQTQLSNKQLSTLVIAHPWYLRVGRAFLLVGRKAAPPAAAAAVATIAVISFNNSSFFASSDETNAPEHVATLPPQTEPSILVSDPLFVMGNSVDESKADHLRLQELSNTPIDATYQISVMAPAHAETRYQLNAQPRTFSSPPFLYSIPELRSNIQGPEQDF